MYDTKDCLKTIKQMHGLNSWVKVLHKISKNENKKYKSENERYNAIYGEILKCSSQEKENLEVLLRCEKGAAERLMSFLSIISVFVSILSMMVSLFSGIIKQANNMTPQDYVDFIGVIGICAIIAVLLYTFVYNMSSKSLDKTTYLLGVLEKVKEYGRNGNKTKRS